MLKKKTFQVHEAYSKYFNVFLNPKTNSNFPKLHILALDSIKSAMQSRI